MNKAHRSFIYLYICTFIFIYVSYRLPNVWTDFRINLRRLFDLFFHGHTMGAERYG